MQAKEYIKRYGENVANVCITNRTYGSDGLIDKPSGESRWFPFPEFLELFGELEVDDLNGDFFKFDKDGYRCGLHDAFIITAR